MKQKKSPLVIILIVSTLIGSIFAQIRVKQPKVDISLAGGYDNNIIRVSEAADSNRVSGYSQKLNLSVDEWIYWTGGMKSYLSFSGDYNWFSPDYPENAGNGYLKLKTYVDIPEFSTGHWVPEMRWDFEIRGAILDRYYSNRALGEEFSTVIDRISGRTLALGDLFDRKYVRFSTGFRFLFSQGIMLELEYYRQLNNYTDIGDPATEDFYSLDNSENDFKGDISVSPTSWLTVQLGYNHSSRMYDHKLASDINGDPIPDLNRKYVYNEYDIRFMGSFERIDAYLRYLSRLRSDDRDGYYGYKAQKISVGASYRFLPQWVLYLDYDSSHKLYDHITLGGNILDNKYFDFSGQIEYQLSNTFSIAAGYIYEAEDSSYEKFTYTRHISYFKLAYNLL